jgi:hypothetical protein
LKGIAPLRHPAPAMVLIDTDMIVCRALTELIELASGDRVVAVRNDRDRFVPEWGDLLGLGPTWPRPYVSSGLVFLGGASGQQVIHLLDDLKAEVDFELTFWRRNGEVRRGVSKKARARFKDRIRMLTRRTRGRSIDQVVDELKAYLRGWKGYFQLAQTPSVFRDLDEWLRHRLRTLHLKQWKRGKTMYRALVALGASPEHARQVAANSRSWWRNGAKALNRILTLAYFDRLGLPRLS